MKFFIMAGVITFVCLLAFVNILISIYADNKLDADFVIVFCVLTVVEIVVSLVIAGFLTT